MEGASSGCRGSDRPRHWLHRHLQAGTWHNALRASRQHVRRLVSDDGLVNGSQRAEQALAGLRQRRVVRTVDLRRINQHTLEELEPEISSPEDTRPSRSTDP